MCGSTCFGRPHAHHQELNNCSAVGRGRYGRPDHDQQHCYNHAPTVKPEAATAVVELLMMDVRTPETCSATHKRQVINLRDFCIWLVDLFELTRYLTRLCLLLPCSRLLSWVIFVFPIAVTENMNKCLCRNFHDSVLVFVLHAAVVHSSGLYL